MASLIEVMKSRSLASDNFVRRSTEEDNLWRQVEELGRISLTDFKITLGVLTGIAFICSLVRLGVRLNLSRRLHIDDGFLIVAFACLSVASGIILARGNMVYLVFAIALQNSAALRLAATLMDELFIQNSWQFVYMITLWTSIFAVKLSFFFYFRPLLRSMPMAMVRYYWFAIAFSVACWIFSVLQYLITCHYFGKASIKCALNSTDPSSLTTAADALVYVGPALDITTDFMVMSIPIMVLSKSQMKLSTKASLGSILCLSGMMIGCCIVRTATPKFRGIEDYPWQFFWLHIEGCIAVMMSSFTVFRTALFFGSHRDSEPETHSFRSHLVKLYSRIWPRRSSQENKSRSSERKQSRRMPWRLPSIPRAKLTGLRTVFAPGLTSTASTTLADSTFDPHEMDYHAYMREPERSQEKVSRPQEARTSWSIGTYDSVRYKSDSS